jgi:NAD(P)-dependent dehydrogenase (short-subunit alcohol dehydrogenase family)
LSSVNSKAAFLILQESAKTVQDGGKIITIVTSLLAAFTGMYTAYAGSKAPVEHFTRGAAKELSGRRISVNAIAPGPMDTRELDLHPNCQRLKWRCANWLCVAFFYSQESEGSVEFHKSMAVEGRLTEVQDIAPIVRFLCTAGKWVNGQTIFANGGYNGR